MKRTFAAIVLSLGSLACLAAGNEYEPIAAHIDVSDTAALQRGARLFVNFCFGCHSLDYMRYNRIGRDLHIPDAEVKKNLLFAADKTTALMTNAMHAADAKRWFGNPPPDLSDIARSRGPDWLYSYLVTFYADPNPARPFGVNNVMFPDVAMPNVLTPLQGTQVVERGKMPDNVVSVDADRVVAAGNELRVIKTVLTGDGARHEVEDVLKVTKPGAMQPGQYHRAMRDLVSFLAYAGEPAQFSRHAVGIWVLAFVAVLFFLSRALYKEYWKDVH